MEDIVRDQALTEYFRKVIVPEWKSVTDRNGKPQTLKKFARAGGVTLSCIVSIYHSKYDVGNKSRAAIARALGISLGELYTRAETWWAETGRAAWEIEHRKDEERQYPNKALAEEKLRRSWPSIAESKQAIDVVHKTMRPKIDLPTAVWIAILTEHARLLPPPEEESEPLSDEEEAQLLLSPEASLDSVVDRAVSARDGRKRESGARALRP